MSENNEQETVSAIHAYLAALSSLSAANVVDLLTEDCVIRMPYAAPPFPEEVSGKASLAPFFAGALGYFSNFEPHEVTVEILPASGRVLVEYRSKATLANGNPYGQQYVILARVRDGLISEWVEYFDPTAFSDPTPELGS